MIISFYYCCQFIINMKKYFISLVLAFFVTSFILSCNSQEEKPPVSTEEGLSFGGDISIIKKLKEYGAVYRINGVQKEGLVIFKENNYTWIRLRIFHTPDGVGPVCNTLAYTIELAKEAKNLGYKILLDFHYSDTWADPGKQYVPAAWNNLTFSVLADSVRKYTNKVITSMDKAGVFPEMVQIGNEINNGMLWPYGKLYADNGVTNWRGLTDLIKAGINGVKDAKNGGNIRIMIHAATGGNSSESNTFYTKMSEYGVSFDVIGLSYYPWWHGTFDQLESNLQMLSDKFSQEISVVETAYYANGWYPTPDKWTLDVKPYPPTEQGQYDFLVELATRLKKYPKVKSLYYWEPETVEIPASKIFYLGRSLFTKEGNAFKGISAWVEGK